LLYSLDWWATIFGALALLAASDAAAPAK